MEKIFIGILLGFMILTGIMACKNKRNMKKYKWSAALCAPLNYPVRVYKGDFNSDDDWEPMTSGGILEEGWGTSGMRMGTTTIIPNSFTITYLSFVENKFYTGEFPLPADRIEALFEEGFYDDYTKEKMTYSSIVVGMAPGGIVVVWMFGAYKVVEIGRYQAVETEVDWDLFNPLGEKDRDTYVKNILKASPRALENLEKNGIRYDIWDVYRKRYTWKLNIVLPERSKLIIQYFSMYNGEREEQFDEALQANAYTKRAIPKSIGFQWFDKKGERYGTEYDFDETEIITAFNEIFGDDEEMEGELMIRIDSQNYKNLSVHLRNRTEEIELVNRRSYGTYHMQPRK